MGSLSVNHLVGIKELSKEDIELIFQTADNFKSVINRPIKKVPSLRDITIANLFFENSTRTRLSFELAEKRLSADVINFSAASSSVKKGETLIDTVNNILAMKVDMVVIRHPNPGAAKFLSENVDSRIINAGDGAHEHPTQALLDAYSINEKLDTLVGSMGQEGDIPDPAQDPSLAPPVPFAPATPLNFTEFMTTPQQDPSSNGTGSANAVFGDVRPMSVSDPDIETKGSLFNKQ